VLYHSSYCCAWRAKKKEEREERGVEKAKEKRKRYTTNRFAGAKKQKYGEKRCKGKEQQLT
jgi:hypothetical protein